CPPEPQPLLAWYREPVVVGYGTCSQKTPEIRSGASQPAPYPIPTPPRVVR
ncbi:MAG: hypothetical protein AVDCRST_MAG73-4030, partial [uncultured Thermomicrobiales bacterium]